MKRCVALVLLILLVGSAAVTIFWPSSGLSYAVPQVATGWARHRAAWAERTVRVRAVARFLGNSGGVEMVELSDHPPTARQPKTVIYVPASLVIHGHVSGVGARRNALCQHRAIPRSRGGLSGAPGSAVAVACAPSVNSSRARPRDKRLHL